MRLVFACLSAAVALVLAAEAPAGVHRLRSGHPRGPQAPLAPRELHGLAAHGHTLIELDRTRGPLAFPLLRRHGAELVSERLQIWRIRSAFAAKIVGELQVAGALRAVSPDRPLRSPTDVRRPFGLATGDPLAADEYWIKAVGANRVEPPPPGTAVTVIDTGVDLSHPEFRDRPDTRALNEQQVFGRDDDHGTAVSSVVAAPENGLGVVGVYPRATLWVWDASPNGRGNLSNEIRGLDVATRRGTGIINLSLGSEGYDAIEDDAIQAAFGEGSIVVAASGNEFEEGNPEEYPASLNHVLTVAATNRRNQPASFSSSSRAVDLAAPGTSIPVAVPLSYEPSGYDAWDGTSFSSPLVAGAAAWVWTERPELDHTQLFEVMRRSARDIWTKGVDRETGYGLLDIPRALAFKAPPVDPQEPNDDVDQVRPNGLFIGGSPLLTTAAAPTAALRAHLDASEDPDDLYRVVVPPGRMVLVYAAANHDVDLDLWGPRTRSVFERGADLERDLLVASERAGKRRELVRWANRARHAVVLYADVFLGERVDGADYALSVRTVPAPARP